MNAKLYVTIKEEVFEDPSMQFVKDKLIPFRGYPVLEIVGDKFLILGENNEFVEMFPRKCNFLRRD